VTRFSQVYLVRPALPALRGWQRGAESWVGPMALGAGHGSVVPDQGTTDSSTFSWDEWDRTLEIHCGEFIPRILKV
jgi:hypothetical protein